MYAAPLKEPACHSPIAPAMTLFPERAIEYPRSKSIAASFATSFVV